MKTLKALALVSSLVLVTACSKEHENEAKDYYKHVYWPLTTVLETAIKNFDTNTEVPLKDDKHCAHNIAIEMNKDRAGIKKLFNEGQDKIIAAIQESYTEEELKQINDFYESKGGSHFASLDEFNKTLKLIEDSEYKEELQNINQDQTLTLEKKFALVAELALKLIPEEEKKQIQDFEASAAGKKMNETQVALGTKVNESLAPFNEKTKDLAKYGPQIMEACKDVIAQNQAAAKAKAEAAAKSEPAKPAEKAPAKKSN